MAPQVGFEPTTDRLTADSSTTELLRNKSLATSYSHRGNAPTTIGAEELNFRVRYGNGCDLFAIVTKLLEGFIPSKLDNVRTFINVLLRLLASRGRFTSSVKVYDFSLRSSSACRGCTVACAFLFWLSPRSISISQLHMSPCFHL